MSAPSPSFPRRRESLSSLFKSDDQPFRLLKSDDQPLGLLKSDSRLRGNDGTSVCGECK